jgi:uroporphyrin-III C-methyltransferase
MTIGKVFLVGAGPGDPELITVRGVNALRQADVVMYDRLAHPALLDYAPQDAERIYVGRAPGDPRSSRGRNRQGHINRMLIQHACGGSIVVRLKGGDPFVFGRGGEEALALSEAGVPFEVIPGVSASIAVPEAAFIPVTHRGVATSFAVFAGHEAGDASVSGTDWEIAARIPTAIFLMGVERLPAIVAELLAHGRRTDTPVALIEQGTLVNQRVITGTLDNIILRASDARPPATVVVGDVVSIREAILTGPIHRGEFNHLLQTDRSNRIEQSQDDTLDPFDTIDFAAWRRIAEPLGDPRPRRWESSRG